MKSPTPLVNDFRWHFASMNPSEGLLTLPVVLGVTRCFAESRSAKDPQGSFLKLLSKLQSALGPSFGPNLVRTKKRDLLRNSGQYWAVLGLIEERILTPLGQQVADGTVTPSAFATRSINDFTIPHRYYEKSTRESLSIHGIQFRPLLLLLEIIDLLRKSGHVAELSMAELKSVVVPGSCARLDADHLADLLIQRRRNPAAFRDVIGRYTSNEHRTLRAFPLYLSRLQLLRSEGKGDSERFIATVTVDSTEYAKASAAGLPTSAAPSKDLVLGPDTVERAMRETRRRDRAGQTKFRRRVEELCGGRCIITGESLPGVLEAAHLRSVEAGGSDDHSNGVLLRVDLHRLFDSGQLRIDESGQIQATAQVRASASYVALPTHIQLPAHIDKRHLMHRFITSC